MSWEMLLLIAMVTLLIAFAIKLPVALALALSGFVGLISIGGWSLAQNALGQIVFSANQNFLLVAIPLFILMAELLTSSGVSTRAFGAVKALFGRRSSTIPLATIGLGAVLAAVSGSSAANVASLGRVALREMVDQGHRKPLAVGAVAAAGGLGIIIPPSIPAILYGFVNEVSVIRIFTAGIIPGLLLAFFSMVLVVLWDSRSRRVTSKDREVKLETMSSSPPRPTRLMERLSEGAHIGEEPPAPSLTPEEKAVLQGDLFPSRWSAGLQLIPLLGLVGVVLGTIYAGVATPTEAAALGVAGALVVSYVGGELTWATASEALARSLKSSGFILLILFGAVYFVFFLNRARIPNEIVALAAESPAGPFTLLVISIVIMIILGALMETISLVLVATPIIAPVLVTAGFDPIAIAIIMLLLIEMGLNTPPVGLNIFILLGVGKPVGITYMEIVKGCAVFLLPSFAVIAVVLAFPGVATLGRG